MTAERVAWLTRSCARARVCVCVRVSVCVSICCSQQGERLDWQLTSEVQTQFCRLSHVFVYTHAHARTHARTHDLFFSLFLYFYISISLFLLHRHTHTRTNHRVTQVINKSIKVNYVRFITSSGRGSPYSPLKPTTSRVYERV